MTTAFFGKSTDLEFNLNIIVCLSIKFGFRSHETPNFAEHFTFNFNLYSLYLRYNRVFQ